MKKQFISLSLLLLVSIAVFAQTGKAISVTAPEAAGFSAERLKRLDNSLNEWVQKEWMNGAAAVIIRNGKLVL
jgi:hypothetical protein